jgi:predicted ATPase with chaperone activity
MNELIIEGLIEEDIKLLKEIVESYKLSVKDYNKVIRVKELNDKLIQILNYFND